jgi:hypothetical protein
MSEGSHLNPLSPPDFGGVVCPSNRVPDRGLGRGEGDAGQDRQAGYRGRPKLGGSLVSRQETRIEYRPEKIEKGGQIKAPHAQDPQPKAHKPAPPAKKP